MKSILGKTDLVAVLFELWSQVVLLIVLLMWSALSVVALFCVEV